MGKKDGVCLAVERDFFMSHEVFFFFFFSHESIEGFDVQGGMVGIYSCIKMLLEFVGLFETGMELLAKGFRKVG